MSCRRSRVLKHKTFLLFLHASIVGCLATFNSMHKNAIHTDEGHDQHSWLILYTTDNRYRVAHCIIRYVEGVEVEAGFVRFLRLLDVSNRKSQIKSTQQIHQKNINHHQNKKSLLLRNRKSNISSPPLHLLSPIGYSHFYFSPLMRFLENYNFNGLFIRNSTISISNKDKMSTRCIDQLTKNKKRWVNWSGIINSRHKIGPFTKNEHNLVFSVDDVCDEKINMIAKSQYHLKRQQVSSHRKHQFNNFPFHFWFVFGIFSISSRLLESTTSSCRLSGQLSSPLCHCESSIHFRIICWCDARDLKFFKAKVKFLSWRHSHLSNWDRRGEERRKRKKSHSLSYVSIIQFIHNIQLRHCCWTCCLPIETENISLWIFLKENQL